VSRNYIPNLEIIGEVDDHMVPVYHHLPLLAQWKRSNWFQGFGPLMQLIYLLAWYHSPFASHQAPFFISLDIVGNILESFP
jgi:hypothetical protein